MSSFSPIHKDHGIASAIVVILLKNSLSDFEKLGHKLLENQTVFNHHENSQQIKLESAPDGLTTTKRATNGFILRSNSKAQTLHGFNDDIRTALIYTDTDYNRWAGFYKKIESVLERLQETLPENEIIAVALEYNDDFIWDGEIQDFTWDKLFKTDGDTLSKDFHKHTLLRFEILRKRKIKSKESKKEVLEQLSIIRRAESHVRIQHHLNLDLKNHITTKNLLDPSFTSELTELHKTNKAVLTSLLTKEMALRVGLIKK